jgi:hypothetical protein
LVTYIVRCFSMAQLRNGVLLCEVFLHGCFIMLSFVDNWRFSERHEYV